MRARGIAEDRQTCLACLHLIDRDGPGGVLVEHPDTDNPSGPVPCRGSALLPWDVEPWVDFRPPTDEVVLCTRMNVYRWASDGGLITLRRASRILHWSSERTRALAEEGVLPSVWLELHGDFRTGVRVPMLRKRPVREFSEQRRHRNWLA